MIYISNTVDYKDQVVQFEIKKVLHLHDKDVHRIVGVSGSLYDGERLG